MNGLFFLNSFLLGIGLAMDAFSVSMANGLNEPEMRRKRMAAMAFVYAGFVYIRLFFTSKLFSSSFPGLPCFCFSISVVKC